MKYPPRRPGGWLEGACFKTAVYLPADGTLSVLRNAPLVSCAVAIIEQDLVNEIFKADRAA
jgi:hypothetical protein